MAKPGRWCKVNYAGVKKGEIDLFRTHLDSRAEFANSSFRSCMGAKVRSALEGEAGGVLVVSLGLPAFPGTPLIPAHFLKESSVAIAIGLLGPQDVGGLEGLAVLLLGSLDVVLWRAEEAVSKQVPGGNQRWCRGEGVRGLRHRPRPPLCFRHCLGRPPSGPGENRRLKGTRAQPGRALGNVTSLCWWQEEERSIEASAEQAAWIVRPLKRGWKGRGPRQHQGVGALPLSSPPHGSAVPLRLLSHPCVAPTPKTSP